MKFSLIIFTPFVIQQGRRKAKEVFFKITKKKKVAGKPIEFPNFGNAL